MLCGWLGCCWMGFLLVFMCVFSRLLSWCVRYWVWLSWLVLCFG